MTKALKILLGKRAIGMPVSVPLTKGAVLEAKS